MKGKIMRKCGVWEWLAGATAAAVLLALGLGVMFLVSGCGTVDPNGNARLNWVDKHLYDLQTNWTPHVVTQTVVQTNFVPVPVLQVVTNVVVVHDQAGVASSQTNVVTVTNTEQRVSWTTNSVTQTNLTASIELKDKAGVETGLSAVGGTIGGLFGFGGVATTGLLGLYHIYSRVRNRKLTGALVQGIETGRELLANTPQGQALADQYTAWLVGHQKAAGVLDLAAKAVDAWTDNEKAAEDAAAMTPVAAAATGV